MGKDKKEDNEKVAEKGEGKLKKVKKDKEEKGKEVLTVETEGLGEERKSKKRKKRDGEDKLPVGEDDRSKRHKGADLTGNKDDLIEDVKKSDESSAKNDVALKTYEELVELVSIIAKPMASKKLTKKLYKIVKKSATAKHLKRGVKEVVKGLRKDMKGLVILAGDISPIDVISHIPVYCEDKGVPYCYVPSRRELGAASLTKRPTSVVLVQSEENYATLYKDCYNVVDALPLPI